jgi:hypothetical protein
MNYFMFNTSQSSREIQQNEVNIEELYAECRPVLPTLLLFITQMCMFLSISGFQSHIVSHVSHWCHQQGYKGSSECLKAIY